MSEIDAPLMTINIRDSRRSGLLARVDSDTLLNAEDWVNNDGKEFRLALVAPKDVPVNGRKYDYIDLTGATVEMAIGNVNQSATGGTFAGTYGADTTGLTALAYDISAAALRTALLTNPGVTATGTVTVTVTKINARTWQIKWDTVGARTLMVWSSANLTPECTAVGSRVVVGDASNFEVQILRITQRPYAYNATWTASPAAAATVTQIQTGTSSKPSIQRITLSPEPFDGSFVAAFSAANVVRVICKADTGAVAEVATITCTADSAGSLHGTVAALFFDTSGNGIQILLSNGGTIATSVPSGGRRITVTFANNDTAATIAGLIDTAVSADAVLDASVSTALVTVTQRSKGARSAPQTGSSAFAVARTVVGAFGLLHGTYCVLYDDTNKSCGIYLTESGDPPAVDNVVLTLDRYLSVTITAGNTATQIGTSITTIVDADPDFTCSNSSGILTITNALTGTRTAADSGTTGMGVAVTTAGMAIAPTLPYNASGPQFQSALGPLFVVSKSGPFQWDIQFVAVGAQSAFTTVATGLLVASYLKGTLNLATQQTLSAIEAGGVDPLPALIEGQITFPGKLPWTFYRAVINIYADLIDFSTLYPTASGSGLTSASGVQFLPLVTGYTGGGSTNLDGVLTVSLAIPQIFIFKHSADGGRIYILRTGTDAEASPSIIRPDDYNAVSNAKVWESIL